MDQSYLVNLLKKPETFNESGSDVTLMQTHISYVALVGEYAYKIKKPVDFGFLDFSTLEKRKYYCEEELRLNKRLCPQIYDAVVTLNQQDDDTLLVDGTGKIVEYAVRMHRFSQDHLMNVLLKKQKVKRNHIQQIGDILVDFYQHQNPSEKINRYGSVESIKHNIDENFDQTEDVIDVTISKALFTFLKEKNNKFFRENKKVFDQRKENGYIYDCHGDLHSGNIVIDDDICIFDCIEFNKRFRYIDVASDIGFLAMDLDMMNYPFLSSFLIQHYVEKSKDTGLYKVLNFYKSYRAYVRGKVTGFQLADNQISSDEKDSIVDLAKTYFDLSFYYARLFDLQRRKKKPLLILISGLTGTGKSTLASKIAVDYDATVFNTDIIRKKQAGIDTFERHHDEPDTGLYAPEKVAATYERLLRKAEGLLCSNISVLLDATFQKRKYRDKARSLAENNNALFVAVECICPEDIAYDWLQQRLKQKTVSDGRWEIYQQQRKTFESFTADEDHINIDMSKDDYYERMNSFNLLLNSIEQQV